MDKITHIVTDIEGTTTSISFVKDILFPYAREHMAEFLSGTEVYSPELERILMEIPGSSLEAKTQLLIKYIDEDRKYTPLKELQGLIWKQGYEQGVYRSHVYEDAYKVLCDWHREGIQLYVYSSGSIAAQKLLFGHTEYGDLNYLFSDNFDTHIGAKNSASSYRYILKTLGTEPTKVLFLSDIDAELEAAQASGMQVAKLVRDPRTPLGTAFPEFRDFYEIQDALNSVSDE